MSDTQAPEKRPGILAKAGAPEKGEFPLKKVESSDTGGEGMGSQEPGKQVAEKKDAPPKDKVETADHTITKDKPAADAPPADINDEAVKSYFKKLGIDYTGAEDLKQKLNPKAEPTEEEKKKKALEQDKRLLDLWVARNGTPEQYVNIQKLASGDPIELGKLKLKQDMAAAGIPAEEMDALIKQMHMDISDDEMADLPPEKQEQIKKQRAFGAKKLVNRGVYIQKDAQSIIDDLNREAKDKDTENERKKQHASNVEAALTSYQRKQTLDLGKVDDIQVPPLEIDVPESILTEASNLLKDKAKLESQIYNKDGSFNLDFLLPNIVNNLLYKHTARATYLEAQHRNTQAGLQNFSPKPPALGGNADTKGTPGKIVKAGAPERIRTGK